MKKKTAEKIPLQDYIKQKERSSHKLFKLKIYPWPVLLALSIPFAIFILLILIYFFYVKGLSA